MMGETFKRPNILITGTPGTGKTTTAQLLSERTGLQHINVGQLVVENGCYSGIDSDYDTHILDEDKLLDTMETIMAEGGKIVDFHSCEIFPERWFDLVLVLHAETSTLYDRLTARNYNKKKLDENMEAEIMQIVSEAAKESYDGGIVHELDSNTVEDLESNLERASIWLDSFYKNHSGS